MTGSPPFPDAIKLYQNGDLSTAEAICRAILEREPHHAEALHLAGAIAHRANRPEAALEQMRRAVEIDPNNASFHYNLGTIQQVQGHLEEAAVSYAEALRLQPNFAEAASNRGYALTTLGRRAEAVAQLQKAIQIKPDYPAAYNNLGFVLLESKQWDEAIRALRQAVALKPDYVEAQENLGLAFMRSERYAEAIDPFRKALALKPNDPTLPNNLGFVLKEAGHLTEALEQIRRAVDLDPQFAAAHNNLGVVLTDLGRGEEAIPHLRLCLQLNPDNADTYHNLALAFAAQGDFPPALAAVDKALELEPDHAKAHMCRAVTWLKMGDFERGWPEFEWRWRQPELPERTFRQPRWNGSPLTGKRILLHAEQGFGDTLQFIRFAPLVKRLGAYVIVECQKPLMALLSRCRGIDEWFPRDAALPDFDCHLPLMSLPAALKTTLATIPAEVPYLHADPLLVSYWQKELQGMPGFKIGIAWQGNPQYPGDRNRSFPLHHFAALARLPGVCLISLQKNAGSEQIDAVSDRHLILNLARRLDEGGSAFLDTAAALKQFDLVVTSDTSLAHLAGGLGVPVWLVLGKAAEYRWLADRDDSPWYPTMKLFRQIRWGDWDEVFQRITRELQSRLNPRGVVNGILAPVAPGELLDKISILQIKSERFQDEAKLANVRIELAALWVSRNRALPPLAELDSLEAELKSINERLWDIEDAIRDCERAKDFGPPFIELARSVYRVNQARFELKRSINELLGSRIREEKDYAACD